VAVRIHHITSQHSGDIFEILSTDRQRELSENIRREASVKFTNMFGAGYDQRSDVQQYLGIIARRSETAKAIIEGSLNHTFVKNNITAIDTVQKLLAGVPERMHVMLMMSPGLRDALARDEIYGFGLKIEQVPYYDIYDRMMNSGTVSDRCPHNESFRRSTDPDLTISELNALEDTRNFMEHLLFRGIDPTNYPNPVGKIR